MLNIKEIIKYYKRDENFFHISKKQEKTVDKNNLLAKVIIINTDNSRVPFEKMKKSKHLITTFQTDMWLLIKGSYTQPNHDFIFTNLKQSRG